MSKLYVAYGSNINTAQMNRRCPDAKKIEVGTVQNMQLVFNKVATLHSVPGEQTPALVWQLSDEDEKKLDVYEGFPHKYHKEQVEVEINGEIFHGMAYIMNDKTNMQEPTQEYFNRIADGYAEHGIDLIHLEEAYDRALEFEQQHYKNLSFFDEQYMASSGISNNPNDLLFQAFVVGQTSERYGIPFTPEEVRNFTRFMAEDFSTNSAFMNFEEYADDLISTLTEEYYEQSEEKKYYVAYGSNMNLDQMARRCPNSTVCGTGKIQDYKLQFCTYADIEKQEGHSAPCVIWEIADSDWRGLDCYEGYPNLYRKENVQVVTSDGKTITAIAYVMQPNHAVPAIPYKAYFDGIIEGYKQNNIPLAPLSKALNETIARENAAIRAKSRGGGRK